MTSGTYPRGHDVIYDYGIYLPVTSLDKPTHHDALSFPSHYADQYEPVEEIVAGYYGEPDDTQWVVYDDNYWLDNDDTPNGVYND